MTRTLRLLPFSASEGTSHMAWDETMLEAAVLGQASLRFYIWNQPTLTLGYFQPAAVRREFEPLTQLPWVRRSTGGATIVHHHELTYALALPAGKEWQGTESWICRFHHIVQGVLAMHNVASHAVVCGEERKLGEVICFLHQTPGDLLVNGSKVAGSAQRKMRGAMLQHGSILLNRSEFATMLPGIHDGAGRNIFTPTSLATLLATQFTRETGWILECGQWTEDERERAEAIRHEKYANPHWNEKR